MKTILVPVDFSKCAANAFRYALETAVRTGSQISVLHVVYPNEGVDNDVYSAFWIDEYYKQREADLRNWVRRHTRSETFKKVAVRSHCTIGFPVGAINESVEKERADMVIMGTTGATGLRGVFLGSVASGVIARTKVPVLVVPQKANFKEKGKAVFATDLRPIKSALTFNILHELPQVQKSELHVVHILDKPGTPEKAYESALSQKLGNIKHDFHYLHDRDVIQAVINFLESTDANMLVAVTHEHSLLHRLFYDSTTRRLAQKVKVPTLALHDA